jgi:hypothetical protein
MAGPLLGLAVLFPVLIAAAVHRSIPLSVVIPIGFLAVVGAYIVGVAPALVTGLLSLWIARRRAPVAIECALTGLIGAVTPIILWSFVGLLKGEPSGTPESWLLTILYLMPSGAFGGAGCAYLARRFSATP